MFTQVGVKTIVAGGIPATGPMQAVGGTRGAATYSGAALDADLTTLSQLNVSAEVMAATPPLLDNGMFINLCMKTCANNRFRCS